MKSATPTVRSCLSAGFASALLATALLAAALPATAAEPARTAYRSPAEIIAAAPAGDWRTPDPANLLYLELDAGRVIFELAPLFAPEHVANIRTLAREKFWDGTSFYRSQDNFVVQFGDPDGEDAAKAKSLGSAKTHLPAEFHRAAKGLAFDRLPDSDGWAREVGFVGGFAVGRDPRADKAWLAHCYGVLGAGRNNDDDSSIGAELYVVTGQSPRQLDDNITVVGRVLSGMEILSTIRRGPPPSGFYEKAEERTPIRSIRLVSELPEAARTPLQVLRTDTQTFRDAVEARRNRIDSFYKRPAGHIDLCNVTVPVRVLPGG
jgi:peptidylprolyl isomerase